MGRDVDLFVRDFIKELREDNAGVFAGAGFSAPACFVNWRDLLRPIADELHLDIEREHDLVAIAQYRFNENGGNRHRLNQLLIDQLTVGSFLFPGARTRKDPVAMREWGTAAQAILRGT